MMDELDKLLKQYLTSNRSAGGEKPLSEEEIRLFVDNRLDGERLERVLDRLSQNAGDRELVAAVRRALASVAEASEERVDESLIRRVLPPASRSGVSCPHCGGAITPFKKPPVRQQWLIALWAGLCLGGFALSFVFPRYFFQCLAVSVLAGFKWIADQRALKTQILVYRALEEPAAGSARRNLQRDDARL